MVEVTIVHHNGSEVVEDFEKIVEMDNCQDLRVWYSDPDSDEEPAYNTYYGASVTEVIP